MTKRVCNPYWRGGILIALLGLLLGMGRSVFAARAVDVEWVVIQGIACVDTNSNAACSPDEVAVPKVQVRSDGTVLATTDATGRFSVRVQAQTVIEFELPAGYESATGELSTQVFESGRLDVPLTIQVVATATAVKPTAIAIKPTATTRAIAAATVAATATIQNTRTPTVSPEPSPTQVLPTATASVISPTDTLTTETPAALTPPTTDAIATATLAPTQTALPQPTETITTAAVIVAGDASPTVQPEVSATPNNAPSAPLPSFEQEAQSSSQSGPQFSLGAIPQVYFVSGGLLLGLGLLIGLFVFRSNALKTHGLATASTAGGYAVGSQAVVWDQGSSQQIIQTPQVQQAPRTPIIAMGKEWHPTAQRLLNQAHLKAISIDAEVGILAASTVPAPVFVLGAGDGYRLVFTIDPSLPVRSGLVADRSQVSRIVKFSGGSRGEAHNLWKQVAQSRNLANPACPAWADWYLLVCQRINQTIN